MKKVISLLLVTAMMLSSFAFSFNVVAETTGLTFANCTDANGNLLNAHAVNRTWTYSSTDSTLRANSAFAASLAFDNKLNKNRVETEIYLNDDGSTDAYERNGIMFALTDHDGDWKFSLGSTDNSLYMLCINGDNTIGLWEFGKYAVPNYCPNPSNPDVFQSGYEQLDINPDDTEKFSLDLNLNPANGVKLAAEWDNEGNIKGYVNGKLTFEYKDTTPLTGDLYGIFFNRNWVNGDIASEQTNGTYVKYFTAGLPTFDNCKDGNENQLDTYYVNSLNAWTYENGKLDISSSAKEALLLFDNPLNQNIIEVDFYTPTNGKPDGVKEGITFAYDEATNSYYWLYVSSDQSLRLAKIVNGAQDGGLLLNQSVDSILKDSEANNITVTWNETTGAIDISFNGQNYPATDTSALTGDLYGLLVKNTYGVDSGSYFESFKAGVQTTITATPSLPEKVGHNVGTTFNASITADVWSENDNYKAIEMVITIPEKVTVTNVTAGNRLNGGQLSWKQDGTTLRISYLSTTYDNITITPNSELKAELFNIEFCVEDDLTVGETFDVTLVEAELALKSDTSAPDYNVNILPTEETDRTASAEIVEGTTFTVKDLYTGAGFDVIPADKKAVLVTVTKPENTNELTYNDGTTTIIFKYNAEISAKLSTDGSIIAYVALVDVNTTIEATGKNFTFGDTASNLIFGDVNNDGILNASDALAVINMWLRADTEITDDKILAANVNGDGNIDTYDALGIVENFVKDFDYVIITKVVATNN